MVPIRHIAALAACVAAMLLVEGCSRPAARPAPEGSAEPPSSARAVEAPAPSPPVTPAPLVVEGEVVLASAVPDPGTVPYKDCLTFIKYRVLSVEKGKYEKPELLAVRWGMKDGKLAPAARCKPGDRHRLELEPFESHPELARVMQADDTNEYDLTPYWAR